MIFIVQGVLQKSLKDRVKSPYINTINILIGEITVTKIEIL